MGVWRSGENGLDRTWGPTLVARPVRKAEIGVRRRTTHDDIPMISIGRTVRNTFER